VGLPQTVLSPLLYVGPKGWFLGAALFLCGLGGLPLRVRSRLLFGRDLDSLFVRLWRHAENARYRAGLRIAPVREHDQN